MSLTLHEDAFGDPANARFLAVAADIAYFSAGEGKQKYRDELGLEAELISVGNTQAWVGLNDSHIIVAFRGTEAPTRIEGLKDWSAYVRLLPELLAAAASRPPGIGIPIMDANASSHCH